MFIRTGVPYIEPPAPYFSGHGYSELIASGLKHKINGKRVEVSIPKTMPPTERDFIIEKLKHLGFDGTIRFEANYARETETVELLIVVE